MGTTNPAPDDLESVLSSQDAAGQTSEESLATQPNAAVEKLLRPTEGHGEEDKTAPKKFRFMGREWQNPADAEKSVKELRKAHDQHAQKANLLETLLKNPVMRKLAESDQKLASALAKAGYELASQEEDGDPEAAEEAAYEEALKNPVLRHLLVENEKATMRGELRELQEEIGRKLTPDEWSEVKERIQRVPGLSVAEAWTLTPAYRKVAKEREDKRVADELRRRGVAERPVPTTPLLPGQKIDLKKAPHELKTDQEKAAYLQNLIAKAEAKGGS